MHANHVAHELVAHLGVDFSLSPDSSLFIALSWTQGERNIQTSCNGSLSASFTDFFADLTKLLKEEPIIHQPPCAVQIALFRLQLLAMA